MEIISIILVLAIAGGFYASFMGGANDLANSMGTSVGSGVLTLRKAVMVAAVANFLGALLVGQFVTSTIAKGIVSPDAFAQDMNQFVFGMFAALVASGAFLQIANHFALPVSTTHAIVGSVFGFGLIVGGPSSINWTKMGFIVMSWFTSPIVGGLIAFTIFVLVRKFLLESKNPKKAATVELPLFIVFTITVISLSFIYKGLKNLKLGIPFLAALGLALILGLISGAFTLYRIRRAIKKNRTELEVIDRAFRALQVISASFVAFAHGANDVGNGIGPLAAIANVAQKGVYLTKVGVPMWVLFVGALGIVSGLAVLGYRVIETIGKKITEITPVRGFSAEFGAASTVLFASLLGMPISTTHTLVGAVIGVGLARGMHAIDMTMVRKIIASWFVTVPSAAFFTVILFYIIQFIFG